MCMVTPSKLGAIILDWRRQSHYKLAVHDTANQNI